MSQSASGLKAAVPGFAVLNCKYPHRSGRCMSINPCGDHTQLCSVLLVFRYFPSATSVSHSTREKLIRHRSPSFGGSGVTLVFTISCSPFHGHLISTVQPLSVSRGSFRVPSSLTAVFSPVISHA